MLKIFQNANANSYQYNTIYHVLGIHVMTLHKSSHLIKVLAIYWMAHSMTGKL